MRSPTSTILLAGNPSTISIKRVDMPMIVLIRDGMWRTGIVRLRNCEQDSRVAGLGSETNGLAVGPGRHGPAPIMVPASRIIPKLEGLAVKPNMDIEPATLLSAYAQGVFPMADRDHVIRFYTADPRGLVPLDQRFHV